MKSYEITKLGINKNAPRLWLEGQRPLSGGFTPGTRYNISKDLEKSMLTIEVVESGVRVVSRKERGGREMPVIDINSNEVLEMFAGMGSVRVIVQAGRIFVLPIATEIRKKERLASLKDAVINKVISVGSVSHGAGVLSNALEKGLANAGIKSRLAFAIDIDGDSLNHAATVNPIWDKDTLSIAAPLQEMVFDEYLLPKLPKVHLLEGGLPCTAASIAGRAKKHLVKAEDDSDVGHLMASFITLIGRINPAIVLLENVVPYLETASMAIFRTQLRDLGYVVHERILTGEEFGVMENRKRMVAIAVTKGIEFDFESMLSLPAAPGPMSLGGFLDPVPLDDPSYSPLQYLKDKEVRDKDAGKGFMMQVVTPESKSVPTITKGYMKRRSTDPFLRHPENPDLLRLFTPNEHARIKGIPETLIEGLSATRAHQLLGQSILFSPFVATGEAIAKAIRAFVFDEPILVFSEMPAQGDLLAA